MIIEDTPFFGPVRRLELSAYDGPDYSRRAFIFPGQGSAFPGMGATAMAHSPVFREIAARADVVARELSLPPLTGYLSSDATLPALDPAYFYRWQSLALFVAEAGLAASLEARDVHPEIVSGFSFGEWASLHAAGVLAFEDALRLIWLRETACPGAGSLGLMLACRCAAPAARELAVEGDAFVANECSPDLTVISCSPDARTAVMKAARHRRIAVRPLDKVPHPYHSPLMARAADAFRESARRLSFETAPARRAWLSSVDGKLRPAGSVFAPGELVTLMANQLLQAVRFVDQIETLFAGGVRTFVEVGPGSSCTGFVAGILRGRSHHCWPADSDPGRDKSEPRSLTILRADGDSVLRKVSNALAAITGYEFESLVLEEDLQKDHGIDSIKKLELAVSVLPASGGVAEGAVARARTVGDLIRIVAEADAGGGGARAVTRRPAFGRRVGGWVKQGGLHPDAMRTVATFDGTEVTARSLGDLIEVLPLRRDKAWLIMFPGSVAAQAGKGTGIATALSRLREWWRLQDTEVLEVFLAVGPRVDPELAGLEAFFRSIARERAMMSVTAIEFDEWPGTEAVRRIAAFERDEGDEVRVRYEKGERNAWRLHEAPLGNPRPRPGLVIATGGLGGIMMACFEHLLGQSAGWEIVIIGRRAAGHQEVGNALARLEGWGATVHYVSADAGDARALEAGLDSVLKDGRTPAWWLHGAGTELSRSFASPDDGEEARVWATKVDGLRSLLAQARRRGGKVVAFASVASLWGNAGQAVYAWANAVIDVMSGHEPGLVSLRWPAWDSVGMTATPAVLRNLKDRGLALLPAAEGAQALAAEMAAATTGGPVDILDWSDAVALAPVSLRRQSRVEGVLGRLEPDGLWRRELSLRSLSWLADHAPKGTPLLPAAWYVAAAVRWAREMPGFNPVVIGDFRIIRPVAVDRERPLDMQIKPLGENTFSLEFFAMGSVARLQVGKDEGNLTADPMAPLSGRQLITRPYSSRALFHGPSFHFIDAVGKDGLGCWSGEASRLRIGVGSDHEAGFLVAWLDAVMQVSGLAVSDRSGGGVLPVRAGRISIAGEGPPPDKATIEVVADPGPGATTCTKVRSSADRWTMAIEDLQFLPAETTE